MRRRGLSASEVACVRALANILLPRGHELPGAGDVDVAGRLARRAEGWEPKVLARIRILIRSFELGPMFSRHRKRFSRLAPAAQREWTEAAMRSRLGPRRMGALAVKQLLALEWASAPETEEALAFDYRCWRDDEAHGTPSRTDASPNPPVVAPAPADLHRPGPATRGGAIPIRLLSRTGDERGHRPTDLETLEWPDIRDGETLLVDVVVIGSGAGGAVVAAELAERGVDVAILEEGPRVDAARDFDASVFDRFQRFYRDNGTTLVLGKPPIPMPLGKAVGGTTVVNSGTCFRAPERILTRWESEYGLDGVGRSELDEHYVAIEDALNVRPVPWELLGPNGMAAHAGASALGYSGGPLLRNIGDCHGCGQCAFGCPTDAKQAMHVSYLPRATAAGARLLSRCRAERIVVENGRATGVVASLRGANGERKGTVTVLASHVVVAAGAVHSPVLLRRSGVPDASRQTGRNLRIHPASGISGLMDAGPPYWKGTLQSYYIDEFFDSHELMFEATTAVPGVGAGSVPGIGAEAMTELSTFGRLATLGFYVSDTSKGRIVTLPGGEALPVYRLNDLDARRYAFGVATAAEILFEAGASKVYPGIGGMDSITSTRELQALNDRGVRPERMRLTAFHPMGTVRAGRDPERSVVDPIGRHHSVAHLWVTDASTFPSCVGVNPQMTIMALARRSAQRLAEAG